MNNIFIRVLRLSISGISGQVDTRQPDLPGDRLKVRDNRQPFQLPNITQFISLKILGQSIIQGSQ